MIYLSRLVLNPRSREVRRDFADCQELHRTIMSGFPRVDGDADGAREHFKVLFRLEPASRAGGSAMILVQSDLAPDWSGLPASYLARPDDNAPACRTVDATYRAISPGTVCRFRLRANPTRKVETRSDLNGTRHNGRRVPLAGDADRLNWLARKGDAGGFELVSVRGRAEVPDARASAIDEIRGSRRGIGSDGALATRRLTFDGILFDGHLRVTDATRFFETLRDGIGPAKAYGFGLLSVGRAGD